MARYEYVCGNCKKTKVEIHGMLENPRITCPSCLEKMFRRIFATPFIPKCDGFVGKLGDK